MQSSTVSSQRRYGSSNSRFEIVKQIGHGQFSKVYQARWLKRKSSIESNQQTALQQCFHYQNDLSMNQTPQRRSLHDPTNLDGLTQGMHTTQAINKLQLHQSYNQCYHNNHFNTNSYDSLNRIQTIDSEKSINSSNVSNHVDDSVFETESVDVALKHIKLVDIQDAKLRDDCLKEVHLLQQLKHPNIINYIRSFIERNDLYIVLELADGGDLCKLINYFARHERLIIERTILKYFIQICSAVAYIHSKRVLHRDIKPANIFMTSKGIVKLGDFGLGRFFSNNTIDAHSLVGTFYYMSPERINRAGYEFSSDIWSLGCVLYELITLRSPFSKLNIDVNNNQKIQTNIEPAGQSINLNWLIKRICTADYPSLNNFDNASDTIKHLANQCLKPNPLDRPNIDQIYQVVECAYSKYKV